MKLLLSAAIMAGVTNVSLAQNVLDERVKKLNAESADVTMQRLDDIGKAVINQEKRMRSQGLLIAEQGARIAQLESSRYGTREPAQDARSESDDNSVKYVPRSPKTESKGYQTATQTRDKPRMAPVGYVTATATRDVKKPVTKGYVP